jgi:hypothetical protein
MQVRSDLAGHQSVITKSKVVKNEVRFEDRGEYLFAHITGKGESLETTQQNWRAIAAACKRGHYSKALILEDIEGEMPFMEQFAFAAGLKEIGFDGVMVAFVDAKSQQFANNKFAEDVAVNRGANGRLFQTIEAAEAWLLGL